MDERIITDVPHAFAMEIAEEYNGRVVDSVEVHILSPYSEKPLQIVVEGTYHMNIILNNRFMARIGQDKLLPLISVFRATGSVPPELRFV